MWKNSKKNESIMQRLKYSTILIFYLSVLIINLSLSVTNTQWYTFNLLAVLSISLCLWYFPN